MPITIEMPKLSDTMTEGTLIKWHKKVGDLIEIGDVIAEVETDKATMEMEAFDDGTLTQIFVQEGGKCEVGGAIAILDGDEAGGAVAPVAAAPVAVANAAPVATAAATEAPVRSLPESHDENSRVKASPLARKVAAEKGVELSGISGTGPGGRILKEDVLSGKAHVAPSSATQAAKALASVAKGQAVTPSVAAAPQAIQPVAKDGDEIVELSSMRKIIASRLLTSKQTIPHFYLHVEVDAAPVMAMRKQVNENGDNKYTVNDFVLRAVVSAVQAVPAVNASFAGDKMINFKHVGLSVAIAVEDGLVTPVIKQAETKSLLEISRAVKDFAVRAKDRKLKPDEFDGGTITVSNLGAWGIESFDAIVNPPQAAILSVGAAIEKPVVKNGQIVAGLRMNVGLSCDHRVVDGAVAAQFLNEVKKRLEQPALMLI